ncbi:hypothetical protein ACRTDR_20040 [Shewanella algae]
MSYGVSSKDYLSRAKELIAEDRIESLFYAAFEIRCGIEARMNEYLEVQKHISNKKSEVGKYPNSLKISNTHLDLVKRKQ